jgi:uncharacterized protein YcbK (DUF882 family)
VPIVKRAAPLLFALLSSTVALAEPPPTASGARSKTVVPVRYTEHVRTWHAPVDGPVPVDEFGRPLLVLSALNTRERIVLRPAGERGGFAAADLDRAAFLLRDPRSGDAYPVEPRLVDIVYDIETHFQSREIRVVSGYRTPRRLAGSNHGKGRAIDLVVPGANDAEVAAYVRTLGFVGVGVYPTSGFVHVDIRDRSYYWSDSSGPGKRNRERGILGELAATSDQAARARGERPPQPATILFDVDAAIRARAASVAPPEAEEEDLDREASP